MSSIPSRLESQDSSSDGDTTNDDTQALLAPHDDDSSSNGGAATPGMSRSLSAESVVSTQSAPPPYELYAPARTVVGRMYNWLRKIPRFATHQAIYLPTLPIRRQRSQRQNIGSSTLPYNHQPIPRAADSLSSSSIDSFASSAYPTTWCTPYFYRLNNALPRVVLPPPLGRFRGLLAFASIMALQLCCFLLFCSIYFAPADLPAPVVPDKVLMEAGSTAQLLTLNIFMRPPGIKNNWSDYKDDRLDYIIHHILPHYDIIAFQESFAFATRRKDELIKQARLKYGFNHHVESPRKYPWDISVDGGLLVISKFKITQADIIQYPRGTHSDWLSRKGALHACIELNPSRHFHLYTTHTQASYDLNNVINLGDTYIRLGQFAQLHEFVQSTTKHGDPIMILGDLNVDAAVHKGGRLTDPSVESSIHYTMMTNVLTGTGVNPKDLGLSGDDDKRVFAHPWVLDDLVDVVYRHYGYHPVTFGDVDVVDGNRVVPGETTLTDHDQLMTVQSIDRIYWAARNSTSVTLGSPHVEPFKVKENQALSQQERDRLLFTQISALLFEMTQQQEVTIVRYEVCDIRFPTSKHLDGSDAMNKDPDYSAAYIIFYTNDPTLEGHGMTFTCGRGTEVCCSAIEALAVKFINTPLSTLTADMRKTHQICTGDSQLRWIGPEKGAIHLATGAVINAIWDLWAKHEKKPVWKLIVDMTPEEFVACVDFKYITDALTPQEALEILKANQATKAQREVEMRENGYPAYTTSAGWLGYSDDKVRRLCREAKAQGFTYFKQKVGGDKASDIRRAALIREEIGADGVLMMDANQIWDVQEAIDWMQDLLPFKPLFIEEPTSPDDVLGHATIRQALHPHTKVATGEHIQNRIIFKQLFQAKAIDYCQIDSCRVAGVNEIMAILLMAKKFDIPVVPHAGGVGLCEYVQHLSLIDYICVSATIEDRVLEYVDHLHEHFEYPVVIKHGSYVAPLDPGYSITMKRQSIDDYSFPNGRIHKTN